MNAMACYPDPSANIDRFINWVNQISSSFKPTPKKTSDSAIPITTIQSHYDDVALSICGTMLQCCARLRIHTTHSISKQHELRHGEDQHIGELVKLVTSRDYAPERTGDYPFKRVVTDDKLTLGPSAVGRNKDHFSTSRLAERGGAIGFWEDVAFWGIYGLSTDDRMHFSRQRKKWLKNKVLLAIPIDRTIGPKAWLLSQYPSQSNDVWRPVRYAWTAARESNSHAHFVERIFVEKCNLQKVLSCMHLEASLSKTITYGDEPVEIYCADWR